MRQVLSILLIVGSFIAVTCQFQSAVGSQTESVNPANFVQAVTNPYFALRPGTTFIYEGQTEDGIERTEFAVTHETKVILGVTTTVIHDRVMLDGELIEDTFDWFAQDKEGNVWYFGEDSKTYENGVATSTHGSWEAGVDGARPGLIMKANPQAGDVYQQEFYAGVAEDMAEVVGINQTLSTPFGDFSNVLVTREWTPLEPGIAENKYYVPGLGLVLEEVVRGGSGRVELITKSVDDELCDSTSSDDGED